MVISDYGQAYEMGAEGNEVIVGRGEYIGKPACRAPETANAARNRLGGKYDGVAADIYSLGTMLFTLVTNGVPPYKTINDGYYR